MRVKPKLQLLGLVLAAIAFAATNTDSFAALQSAPLEVCDSSIPPTEGAGVTGIFSPNSATTREIRDLSYLVFAICAAIFVVVQGFLVVAIVRGVKAARAAKRDPAGSSREPVQIYGSVPIEVAWTVIPVIIVFVLGMVTIRTIRDIDLTNPPDGALEVTVIGHQWWWEYRYEADARDGITRTIITANELHVPIGRPVWLRLESADVIHSFWVPRLAGKMDLIPGHSNAMWFAAETPGLYLGQCAEYCGTQHAHMLLRVYAEDSAQFDAWRAAQSKPAVEDATVAKGRAVFTQYACMNCHTIAGTSDGMFGPNLTHLASRDTIGSGFIDLTRANLRQWIADPDTMKAGCNMPSLKLADDELDAVTDYLMTLK